MNKKAYLFDFDGTLVDSMPTFSSVMLGILDEYGIPYGEDTVKIITPLGYAGTAAYFVGLGIKESPERLVEKMQQNALDSYAHHIPEKKGVSETLKTLKANGAELCVLTASPHSALDVCLKRLGLYDLFTHVWSCDDFGTTKANPDIYKMAASKMGFRPEDVIFVDDNVNAVRTAREAGMMAYGIFDESSADCVGEMQKSAYRYFKEFSELLEEKDAF